MAWAVTLTFVPSLIVLRLGQIGPLLLLLHLRFFGRQSLDFNIRIYAGRPRSGR